MNKTDIEYRCKILESSINSHKKVKIVYSSLNYKSKEFIFHPYKLFAYNYFWFVLGFEEKNKNVLYIKLNHIEQIEELQEQFYTQKLN